MLPVAITAIENVESRQFMTEVYEQYHRLVYHIVKKWVSEQARQEDIVQDVWIKLVEKSELLLTLEPPKLVSYVAYTARNTSFKHLERQNKEEKLLLSFEDADTDPRCFSFGETPEDIVLKAEWAQSIGQIWTRLPERERLLLEGKYIFHQSNEELADWLGCKPESVRMALTRARRIVMDELTKGVIV